MSAVSPVLDDALAGGAALQPAPAGSARGSGGVNVPEGRPEGPPRGPSVRLRYSPEDTASRPPLGSCRRIVP